LDSKDLAAPHIAQKARSVANFGNVPTVAGEIGVGPAHYSHHERKYVLDITCGEPGYLPCESSASNGRALTPS
jgi:hypothetical protein